MRRFHHLCLALTALCAISLHATAQTTDKPFPVVKPSDIAWKDAGKGVKFAVISGPFATRKEAESFSGLQGMPANPWLRPVKSLQSALLPTGR